MGRTWGFRCGLLVSLLLLTNRATVCADTDCLACHGSTTAVSEAASRLGLAVAPSRLPKLVIRLGQGSVHEGLACTDCHPQAEIVPHPKEMAQQNPCASCHGEAVAAVNQSAHRDPLGGSSQRAQCWDCHTAHDVRPPKDPLSSLAPVHVPRVCLQCHNNNEYLVGVHGHGVELAGLDLAATCISCHGGHDILPASDPASKVHRLNVPQTCGHCHGRVTQTYLRSVHGRNLSAENEDVPTCTECHAAHQTLHPLLPRFRTSSPEQCARCHADKKLAAKYGLRAEVFDTYVADFHGTTAELFIATSPDQPLNKAVCYDCHGYHDVESVRQLGTEKVQQRLLVRCQACHPQATTKFLSAWTAHYVPDRERYPLIYYVNLFYRWLIPSVVGFFLAYIALDVWGRRRRRQP